MTASMHLPVCEIVVRGIEATLVYGMQTLRGMGLCHYRHMIPVDTVKHRSGRAWVHCDLEQPLLTYHLSMLNCDCAQFPLQA